MISDPIEFELFKNALFGVADEMALTVFRTTYSGVLKDNMDYSTALFDGDGVLVAQGLTLPGHLGSMPTAMAAVKAAFAGRVDPGDVFILNDPFQGGMHLPDIFIFKPIFRPRRASADRLGLRGVPSHRCRRPGAGLERVGFDRDLPGRAAHPAAEALRPRRAQRDAVRADREECAGAGQGVRRSAGPARRLPHRRAGAASSWRRVTAPKSSRIT